MAKWQYTRAESWRYPSLGFAATFGDVLEADFAPDANWDEVDGGTAATLPPVDTSNFTEPAAGTIPVYNAVTNRAEYKTLAELELLTQTEQDARYAGLGKTSPARSSSVAALGDSITSYNRGVDSSAQNPGWFWRLVVYSAGRMYPEPGGAVYATAGYTCAQVLATHVPEIEALDAPPGFVFVACGANDLSANGGNDYVADSASVETAHQSILARVQALGAVPILVKVPPNSTGAQISANVVAWNAYIDALGKSRGLPVLDMYAALSTDATGGSWKTGANQDDTHPSALGHDYIAKYALASGVLDLFPAAPTYAGPTWFTQLLTEAQGRFLTDANSDGVADGWSKTDGTGTVVCTREAAVPGDGAIGYWQRIDIPAAIASGGWLQIGSLPSWAVGERLRLRFLVEVTGVTGGTSSQGVTLGMVTVSPTATRGMLGWYHDIDHGAGDVTVTVPSGTTGVYLRMSWPSGQPNAITIRLANVRVDNLDRSPA